MLTDFTLPHVCGFHLSGGEAGVSRPGGAPGEGQDKARTSLRVVVVDDEIFVAMHLEAVLEDLGHSVVAIVSSGEAAVDEVAFHAPDLIFMDINLGGGIDGVEAARRILLNGAAPIVFVSAYGDDATRARIEAIAPGAGLVAKPVTPGALRSAVERATGPIPN